MSDPNAQIVAMILKGYAKRLTVRQLFNALRAVLTKQQMVELGEMLTDEGSKA